MAKDGIQEGRKRVSGTMEEAPERLKTDESLRTERAKTDEAVAAKQEAVAKHADAVIDRAREDADEVLTEARENADVVLDAAREKADGPRGEPKAAVVEERAVADEALRVQRDDADEALRHEREEEARVLRRFLPIERESTDRYLLSERIRSDDALANRDDFLAIVTHDLRDLIGGVVMSAALLTRKAPPTEDGNAILAEVKRIERYAARMNRLIGDLMDVASIDAGKLGVTPAAGDLAALVSEAAESFRASAEAKGVSLTTRIEGAPLLAHFDHDRILQVLANLISNSLKFTPQGGKITIRAERDAGSVRVAVVDTGSGIPADALERIFERFSQVGQNDRRGLGLGLYISRCIVEAHEGKIWAESAPGTGTTISLTLAADPARGS